MFDRIPQWVVSGIMIFPVIVLIGIVLSIITGGNFKVLYWVIIPNLLFEELFEICCNVFAKNETANVISTFVFWFTIGALTDLFSYPFRKN